MPSDADATRALVDRVIRAIARFEVLHGVPCQYVRLNSSDYRILAAACCQPNGAIVVGDPGSVVGKQIIRDERVSAPSVCGLVELAADA